MNETMGIYISIIIVLFILLILSFRLSLILARRAICKVIATFRDFRAVQFQNAMPLAAMGLAPRSFFEFHLLRDYKPWALQTLVRSGIVRMATEGTFYLSEETLNANPEFQAICLLK
jgi:hypothetical protein